MNQGLLKPTEHRKIQFGGTHGWETKAGAGYHLAGAADELVACFTIVGEKSLVALDAEGVVLPQDILLPVQGLLALFAVVGLRHCDSDLLWDTEMFNNEQHGKHYSHT